jgi:hypothetical protein
VEFYLQLINKHDLLHFKKMSTSTRTVFLPDGSSRTTLAATTRTHTAGDRFDTKDTAECAQFQRSSAEFRRLVDETSLLFVTHLSHYVEKHGAKPLLRTADGEAGTGTSFDTVLDIVDGGEHLDHFHSYKGIAATVGPSAQAIEFHTDQGLFIAFASPAMVQMDGTLSGSSTVCILPHLIHTRPPHLSPFPIHPLPSPALVVFNTIPLFECHRMRLKRPRLPAASMYTFPPSHRVRSTSTRTGSTRWLHLTTTRSILC